MNTASPPRPELPVASLERATHKRNSSSIPSPTQIHRRSLHDSTPSTSPPPDPFLESPTPKEPAEPDFGEKFPVSRKSAYSWSSQNTTSSICVDNEDSMESPLLAVARRHLFQKQRRSHELQAASSLFHSHRVDDASIDSSRYPILKSHQEAHHPLRTTNDYEDKNMPMTARTNTIANYIPPRVECKAIKCANPDKDTAGRGSVVSKSNPAYSSPEAATLGVQLVVDDAPEFRQPNASCDTITRLVDIVPRLHRASTHPSPRAKADTTPSRHFQSPVGKPYDSPIEVVSLKPRTLENPPRKKSDPKIQPRSHTGPIFSYSSSEDSFVEIQSGATVDGVVTHDELREVMYEVLDEHRFETVKDMEELHARLIEANRELQVRFD